MSKMVNKQKVSKLIGFFVLIATLASITSFPNSAQAFWGVGDFGINWNPLNDAETVAQTVPITVGAASQASQTAFSAKEFAKDILREVAMATARRALQEATKSTVNWINSGFHGAPLFVENPDSFFRDIAKYEVRNLVDMFGYDDLKYPFGRDFALNTINAYKSRLEDNAAYSASRVLQQQGADEATIRNYQTNFDTGGWNGFLINTQFPQNNYIGFQMEATAELARRVQGTAQTAKEKVEKTLQQGQGFLSPTTCPSNPKYNNGTNEFKRPSFSANLADMDKKYKENMPYCADDANCTEDELARIKQYREDYTLGVAAAKADWAEENECPGGLVATTPGSVVSNQIMNTMSSSVRQSELGAALGNSLSMVFDALINKFIGDGLNSLASKKNPAPADDDWSYGGLTLGSGEGGVNTTWDATPDEIVQLSEFKKKISGYYIGKCTIAEDYAEEDIDKDRCDVLKGTWVQNPAGKDYIPGSLALTKTELELLYNEVPILIDPTTKQIKGNPGLFQMMSQIWPKARDLDICIPGPDVNWEERLKEEVNRNSRKLQTMASNGSGSDATKAEAVTKQLDFAVKFFKDWVNNKMITALPSSILYIDSVKDVHSLAQESKEMTEAQRKKRLALARLEAIESALGSFSTQPESGSAEERQLIALWKQYKAASIDVANTISIENTRNELLKAKDRYNSLVKLTDQCLAERDEKGWGIPGGRLSSYSGQGTANIPQLQDDILKGIAPNSEQALFCNIPVAGGYTHEMFTGPGIVNPPLPMINAKRVLAYKVHTIKSALMAGFTLSNKKTSYVDINLDCNTIYQANILDYKGDLPGTTNITVTDTGPGYEDANEGYCSFPDEIGGEVISEKENCLANGGDWTPLNAQQP